MNADSSPDVRSNKEILAALKPFAVEDRARSWRQVLYTLLPMVLALYAAAAVPWWSLSCVISVAGGLLMVRGFILFHDYMHGAILRDSKLARIVMYGLGVVLLTPPRSWRESHNYHHAHVGRIGAVEDDAAPVITTDIGAFPLLSTDDWRRSTAMERFRYRVIRHPFTIFCAYLSVFMISICLGSLMRDPRKHWPSGLVFLGHCGLLAALWLAGGWHAVVFAGLLPLWTASALGACLFYVQHSFPGVKVFAPDDWNFVRAAMETASCLKTGRFMDWITGSIGYHHVHHLNSGIPFYRLREAMNAVPELQHPVLIRFRIPELTACFRTNLWDRETRRMVSFASVA